MNVNERSADFKVVKTSKHFISVSNSDSNDFGTASHNPAQINITFNNSGITSVSSYTDQIITTMTPISMSIDLNYYNVAEAFRNNKFRIATTTGNLLSVGGTNENAAPIEITLTEGIYRSGAEMAAEILNRLTALNVTWVGGNVMQWTNTSYSAQTNSMTLAYPTAAPAGTPVIVLRTKFTSNNVIYDSSRIWGSTGAVVNNIYEDGAFLLPYANRVAGLPLPSQIDLRTINVIRIHSNIAKRFFAKRGNGTNPTRALSLTDTLFEIPVDVNLGDGLVWQPCDNRYGQTIASNFDELRLTLTDKNDNVIRFVNNAEINFIFSVERDIPTQTNEERIKAIGDYNVFRSY
jgi:hypothetical protein